MADVDADRVKVLLQDARNELADEHARRVVGRIKVLLNEEHQATLAVEQLRGQLTKAEARLASVRKNIEKLEAGDLGALPAEKGEQA